MSDAKPAFKTMDRERIYKYIKQHGDVTIDELLESDLLSEPERYQQLIAVMKRDGLLDEEDGVLTTAVDAGIEEKIDLDGFNVTIRPARQEDISGVIGVIKQVTKNKKYVIAESVEQQLSGDSTLMETHLEDQRFFVATVNNEVIGWCGLEIPSMDKLRHTAELTVGVLEDYRGQGVGLHLMERGLSWAEEKGLHKVYNSVPSSNQAGIRFLEEHGWETEATREDHYLIDEEFVDEVMMAKTLN